VGGEAGSPGSTTAEPGARPTALVLLGAAIGIGLGIFLSALFAGSASAASTLPEGSIAGKAASQVAPSFASAATTPTSAAATSPDLSSPPAQPGSPTALGTVAAVIGTTRSALGPTVRPGVSRLLTLVPPAVAPDLLEVALPGSGPPSAPSLGPRLPAVVARNVAPARLALHGTTRGNPSADDDLRMPAGPPNADPWVTPFAPQPPPVAPSPDRDVTSSGSHPMQGLPPVALLLPVLAVVGLRLPRNTAPRLRFDPRWASPG